MRLDWNDIKARAAAGARLFSGPQGARAAALYSLVGFSEFRALRSRHRAGPTGVLPAPGAAGSYAGFRLHRRPGAASFSRSRSCQYSRFRNHGRTARSTRWWIASTASVLRATAKGWSIFSACTKDSPRQCSRPPPNPSAAGKSEGLAALSRQAATMAATLSNELISARANVLGWTLALILAIN
jgi:hypothetical protein